MFQILALTYERSYKASVYERLALTLVALRWSIVSAAPAPALVTLVDPLGGAGVPISASILGVDTAGRTTYAFTHTTTSVAGQQTVGATEYATVVAASDYFSITDDLIVEGATIAAGAECQLGSGSAVCTTAGAVTTETALGALVLDVPSSTDQSSSATSQPSSTATNKPSSARRSANDFLHSGVVGLLVVTLPLALQLL
ncbi:hypothetical protein C8R45DRAFT_1213305 [Mycena sanguinolenta]|nr:hypothetical protein C8R45DRAFT_1213305 [Mycena sanguinolenta]